MVAIVDLSFQALVTIMGKVLGCKLRGDRVAKPTTYDMEFRQTRFTGFKGLAMQVMP
ncbi:hypothetical protein D3C78_1931050 [compost metagenome]